MVIQTSGVRSFIGDSISKYVNNQVSPTFNESAHIKRAVCCRFILCAEICAKAHLERTRYTELHGVPLSEVKLVQYHLTYALSVT